MKRFLVAIVSVVSAVAPLPAGAPVPTCKGQLVTQQGGPGGDTIFGTALDDVIHGKGGRDFIAAVDGNDVICGGKGGDRIHGGDGFDKANGGKGKDECLRVERKKSC
jgi:Ca2+-binding RTX toxin-like protein